MVEKNANGTGITKNPQAYSVHVHLIHRTDHYGYISSGDISNAAEALTVRKS